MSQSRWRSQKRAVLCLAAVSIASVQAASNATNITTTVCPSDLNYFNASGSVMLSDPILNGSAYPAKVTLDEGGVLVNNSTAPTNPLAYTYTVTTTTAEKDNQTTQGLLSALYVSSPPEINLTSNGVLNNSTWGPYPACAIPIFSLASLAIRRGQTDTGDCSATLGSSCASQLVQALKVYSFFVRDILPMTEICDYAAIFLWNDMVRSDAASRTPVLSHDCAAMLRGDTPESSHSSLAAIPISSPNSSIPLGLANTTCPKSYLNAQSFQLPSSYTPHQLWTSTKNWTQQDSATTQLAAYDAAVRSVIPVLTLFFNISDSNSNSSSGFVGGDVGGVQLSCLRTTYIADDSRVSPALEPAPLIKGPLLSKGAIAGIAVGAVVMLLLILAGLAWLYSKWRGIPVVESLLSSLRRHNKPKTIQEEDVLHSVPPVVTRKNHRGQYEMVDRQDFHT